MLLHLLQLQRISSLNSDDSAYAQCYVGSPRETHKSRYVGLCSLNEIKKRFCKRIHNMLQPWTLLLRWLSNTPDLSLVNHMVSIPLFFLSNWNMLWLILFFPNDGRMFNVNYTLRRLKAMLTTCKLKHAITYDVKIFYLISPREQNIFFSHRCVIFTWKLRNV